MHQNCISNSAHENCEHIRNSMGPLRNKVFASSGWRASRDAERGKINYIRICKIHHWWLTWPCIQTDSCALITINNVHIQCIHKIITKTFIANCYFAFRMNFHSLRRCHILFFLFSHLHTFGRIHAIVCFLHDFTSGQTNSSVYVLVELFSIKTEMKNRKSNILSTLVFAENWKVYAVRLLFVVVVFKLKFRGSAWYINSHRPVNFVKMFQHLHACYGRIVRTCSVYISYSKTTKQHCINAIAVGSGFS